MNNKFLFLSVICLLMQQIGTSQVLHNNGAAVAMQAGVYMHVVGAAQNSSTGVISVQEAAGVPAEIIITNNFINNATAGGNGNFRVAGDWLNNNTFNAGTGSVYLDGAAQIIGGTSSTSFYNLFLEGTGNKTQTINQTVTNILNLGNKELLTQQFSMFVTNSNPNAIVYTTGFVSSLQNGFLSRNTASTNTYLFPVGSSVGTFRYRPVEIIPANNSANAYTVRMANVDATTEGFDRDLVAPDICQTNPLFYHRINRSTGTTPIQMDIYFDENTDGNWQGIANWTTNPNQWEIVIGSTTTASSPLSYARANNWNTFTQTPYILYNENPIAQIDAAGPFCNTDATVTLTATPAGGTWSGNGITDANAGTFDPTVAGTGNHVITYNVGIGECTATAEITIVVEETPVVDITAVGPFCIDDPTVTLSATPPGGTWTGTGITDSNTGLFNPSTAGEGTHTITYTVQSGNCTATGQISIIVYDTPVITITPAGPFCTNDPQVTLSATPSNGTWSGTGITDGNSGTFNPAIAGAGNHIITYTVGSGTCSATEQITITVNPLPVITITPVSNQCVNGNTITLEALPSGGVWSGSGIVNATNGIFNPSVAGIGTHTIVYQVTELCAAQESITITVVSAPTITISGIKESCTGALDGSLTTSVIGGTTPFDYIWNTGDTSPNITNAGTGTYSVTVSDNNGCSSSGSFVLQDPNIPCLIYPNHIYIPNVFSPNNDGQNDILFVRGENVSSIEFIIYNRWGNKIFESTTVSNGWDGTYKGKPTDPGVYVYIVKGQYINGDDFQDKGNVSLVR